MKQTAVEWLHNQLHLNLPLYQDQWAIIEDLMNQAKEMEKEQIQDAFYYGVDVDSFNEHFPYQAAEQYYNENFKSE